MYQCDLIILVFFISVFSIETVYSLKNVNITRKSLNTYNIYIENDKNPLALGSGCIIIMMFVQPLCFGNNKRNNTRGM